MEKIASTKVAGILSQVGPTLRALSDENCALKEKLAFFEKKDRVEKIASQMEAKHLNTDSNYSEKVARLMNEDNLDVMEKAIELSAPQVKLAALSDEPGNAADAISRAEAAILGD